MTNKIKTLRIQNKNYTKKIYLYEGIEELVCWGTSNDFNIYTRQSESKDNKTKSIFKKHYNNLFCSDELEVANKFPDSLKRIAYGGKYLILPQNIEEFYYFGIDKFYITGGNNLTHVDLFIHNRKQNIIIKNDNISFLNVLIDQTKDKKSSLKNITFPQRVNKLVIKKFAGDCSRYPPTKNNKNTDKFINCPQFVNGLFLDNEFYLSVLNANITELSFSLKTMMKNPNRFRVLDFLPSSLKSIYIDKTYICDNFQIKEHKEVHMNGTLNYDSTVNNNLNNIMRGVNRQGADIIKLKNIVSFKNLPNSIQTFHLNLRDDYYIKNIKMPFKLLHFYLPSYMSIINLPIEILKKTLNISHQNKFNMVENINECIEDINYLNKYHSNAINLKAAINQLPNLTLDQIAALEDNPKGIKIISKNELLENADKVTQENRIKRNNKLNKISIEEQTQIIDDRIDKIIDNISRSECSVGKIKFVIKLIESGDLYKLKNCL